MTTGKTMKICRHCTQEIPQSIIDLKQKQRCENVRSALKMAKLLGEPVGRPRHANYELIKKLRLEGLTYSQISEKTKYTRGTVCNALRKLK